MSKLKAILAEICILLSTLSLMWLIGYIVLLITILPGCSIIYDLGYISKCNNQIQLSALSITQTPKGIEITFPKDYKLFDFVFIAKEDNSGEVLYFDRYEEHQQVWLLSDIVCFKEVYAKYGDGYCLWQQEFQLKE